MNLPLELRVHLIWSGSLNLDGIRGGKLLLISLSSTVWVMGKAQFELRMMWDTEASLGMPESRATLGLNFSIKGPSGCQLSYHKEVEWPLPSTLKMKGCTKCLIFKSFLHKQEQSPGIFKVQKFLLFIKYDLTHWHHMDCSPPEMRNQMCLAMAALFQTCMDLKPSPPSCLGEHKCSQETLAPIFLRSGLVQRKALRIDSTSFMTF